MWVGVYQFFNWFGSADDNVMVSRTIFGKNNVIGGLYFCTYNFFFIWNTKCLSQSDHRYIKNLSNLGKCRNGLKNVKLLQMGSNNTQIEKLPLSLFILIFRNDFWITDLKWKAFFKRDYPKKTRSILTIMLVVTLIYHQMIYVCSH